MTRSTPLAGIQPSLKQSLIVPLLQSPHSLQLKFQIHQLWQIRNEAKKKSQITYLPSHRGIQLSIELIVTSFRYTANTITMTIAAVIKCSTI